MARKWICLDDVKICTGKVVSVIVSTKLSTKPRRYTGRILEYTDTNMKLDISEKYESCIVTLDYLEISDIREGEIEDAKQPTTSDNR